MGLVISGRGRDKDLAQNRKAAAYRAACVSAQVKDRLAAALRGVEDASGDDEWLQLASSGGGATIHKRIASPRSYFMRVTLAISGFQLIRGAEDKSLWQAALKFEGRRFWLVDWKATTWSIACESGDADAIASCRKLLKKLLNAANLINKELSEQLRQKAADDGFFIHNPHPQVFQTYKHFRDRVDELSKPSGEKKRRAAGDAGEIITRAWNEGLALGYNAAAMVAFFFSYMELSMDVMLAFQRPRAKTLSEFRQLTWAERCALVFPMQDPTFRRMYPQLREWKKSVRDEALHGFGGAERVLVPLEGIGLVPISYKDLDEMLHSFMGLSPDEAREAVKLFDEFVEWLYSCPSTMYAALYMKRAKPIPFHEKRLAELRSHMTSKKDFGEMLDEEDKFEEYASQERGW